MKLLIDDQFAVETYADKINQQFHRSESQYQTIEERLRSILEDNKIYQNMFEQSISEFKRRNPNITQFCQIPLCHANITTLDSILIDITLQRLLIFFHALKILNNFKALLVMPIQVYQDPLMPGKYICWDGQHTVVVLYMIARLLGEDISKCQIPINVYQSSLKSEMRENFMALNGDAKQPLDDIDKYHQMVYGVRTDGSQKPIWLETEAKQQALENSKMFATHTKFNNTDQPGALTRMQELMNPRYDLKITQQFCEYFAAICDSKRPVQPKECWLMYEFFRQCQIEKIYVDSTYIEELVVSLKIAFNDDFDPEKMMLRAKEAYREHYEHVNGYAYGIRYPEVPLGLTFLIAQIAKNFSKNLPIGPKIWPVQSDYLF